MKKYTMSIQDAVKASISFAQLTIVKRKWVKSRFFSVGITATTTIATSMIPAVVV
jgi:hypothetical protein